MEEEGNGQRYCSRAGDNVSSATHPAAVSFKTDPLELSGFSKLQLIVQNILELLSRNPIQSLQLFLNTFSLSKVSSPSMKKSLQQSGWKPFGSI